MDTDVADTDYVTHEEWMQLNNIIQRIDSNVDAPSTKQEPSPVSVIYMPLPVPGISSNVYLAIVHTVGMSPQQSAANVPPISKTICRKIGKQSKDKLNRKRKVGERGKDKLGPEKKRRAPKSCGLCQRGNKFISFEGKEGCKYNITNVHLPVCAYSSDHKIRIHMCQAIIYASKISHRNYQTKTQTNNT